MNLKKVIICIICIISMVGCSNNENNSTEEPTIMGVKYSSIKQVKLYHENLIVYFDLSQEYELKVLNELSSTLDKTANKISTLDEALGSEVEGIEAYINSNQNYYVQIVFSSPQTIFMEGNAAETHEECDSILFDITDLSLHWSKNNLYVGAMGYSNSENSVKEAFVNLNNDIVEIFNDLGV